jgi:hypothetical protein
MTVLPNNKYKIQRIFPEQKEELNSLSDINIKIVYITKYERGAENCYFIISEIGDRKRKKEI